MMILAGFRPTLFCTVHRCAPNHHLDCLVRFKGFYFCSFSLFVFSANFLYICVYLYSGTESFVNVFRFYFNLLSSFSYFPRCHFQSQQCGICICIVLAWIVFCFILTPRIRDSSYSSYPVTEKSG